MKYFILLSFYMTFTVARPPFRKFLLNVREMRHEVKKNELTIEPPYPAAGFRPSVEFMDPQRLSVTENTVFQGLPVTTFDMPQINQDTQKFQVPFQQDLPVVENSKAQFFNKIHKYSAKSSPTEQQTEANNIQFAPVKINPTKYTILIPKPENVSEPQKVKIKPKKSKQTQKTSTVKSWTTISRKPTTRITPYSKTRNFTQDYKIYMNKDDDGHTEKDAGPTFTTDHTKIPPMEITEAGIHAKHKIDRGSGKHEKLTKISNKLKENINKTFPIKGQVHKKVNNKKKKTNNRKDDYEVFKNEILRQEGKTKSIDKENENERDFIKESDDSKESEENKEIIKKNNLDRNDEYIRNKYYHITEDKKGGIWRGVEPLENKESGEIEKFDDDDVADKHTIEKKEAKYTSYENLNDVGSEEIQKVDNQPEIGVITHKFGFNTNQVNVASNTAKFSSYYQQSNSNPQRMYLKILVPPHFGHTAYYFPKTMQK